MSPTVAEEVRRVVKRAAVHIVNNSAVARRVGYTTRSTEVKDMIYGCANRARQFVTQMTLVYPDTSQVAPYRVKANKMGEDIMAAYKAASAARATDTTLGARERRSSAAGADSGVAGSTDQEANMPQLCKFAAREPGRNEADKKILAEAAAIRDILGGSESLCIASYDEGFFAPERLHGGGVSRPIVDMIQERFAITCGSPRDVWALCSEQNGG